jgi:hypothetical protein
MLAFTLLMTTSGAHAEYRTRTVAAGQSIRVAVHYSYRPDDCSATSGIVKVLSKPQHGKLSNKKVLTTIVHSRFGSVGKCYGKPVGGFEIYYTPAPGFRGADEFSVELFWSPINRHEIDNYLITIQ